MVNPILTSIPIEVFIIGPPSHTWMMFRMIPPIADGMVDAHTSHGVRYHNSKPSTIPEMGGKYHDMRSLEFIQISSNVNIE